MAPEVMYKLNPNTTYDDFFYCAYDISVNLFTIPHQQLSRFQFAS